MEKKSEVPIRIILVGAPSGVQYALQKGTDGLVDVKRSDGSDLVFDLTVILSGQLESGAPRFVGPFAQGKPEERFVYIRIGSMAGDLTSSWSRRAKIHLSGITWPMVEAALAHRGSVIAGRFSGTAKDGSPSCASMRPIEAGWVVAQPM